MYSSTSSADAERAKEVAVGEALAAAKNVVESRFRRMQVEGAVLQTREGRERGGRFLTAEYRVGESWVRCKILLVPSWPGPEGWKVDATVALDDVGRLLIPRSKLKIAEAKRTLSKQDFALAFGNRFGEQLDYYQAIAQLDWMKVSLADLVASTVGEFLRREGFIR